MAAKSREQLISEVLSALGIQVTRDEILQALDAVKPKRARVSAQVDMETFFSNPEGYTLTYNKQTPLEILYDLYTASPENFRQAFAVRKRRERRKREEQQQM